MYVMISFHMLDSSYILSVKRDRLLIDSLSGMVIESNLNVDRGSMHYAPMICMYSLSDRFNLHLKSA